ncbi:MAG TPA: Hsp20/alpha crystallin family protein [Novosphingobium sp.]
MNDPSITPAAPAGRSIDRTSAGPVGWLRHEIDRLFDDFSFALPARGVFNFPTLHDLRPAADLLDAGDSYRLSLELPGLKDDEIDVEYRDGVLAITGEKKDESERKECGCILSERRYGSFRREITLPSDVDADGISADYKRGVLSVKLKKSEDAATKPRKIKIG